MTVWRQQRIRGLPPATFLVIRRSRGESPPHRTGDEALRWGTMRCLTLVAALTLTAAACAAQLTGTRNADAPRLQQRLALQDGAQIELSYRAIHFGEGKWQHLLRNIPRHPAFNDMAVEKPLGRVTTNVSVVVLDNLVPPGSYDLYVTLLRDDGWVLNLRRDGTPPGHSIRWHLHLPPGTEHWPRLWFALGAGVSPRTPTLTVAFGKRKIRIDLEIRGEPVKPAADRD